MVDGKPEVKDERFIGRCDFEFLELIKNAALADDAGTNRKRILRLLEEVKKYAEFHFFSEENIMLDIEYPEYELHRQEHTRLLVAYQDHLYNYSVEAIDLSTLVEFLFEWFALHTTHTDKKLAAHTRLHAEH